MADDDGKRADALASISALERDLSMIHLGTRYWMVTLWLLFTTLFAAALVEANPIPFPPYPPEPDTTFRVESTVFGIAWLAIVNLVVDLFLLSLVLYVVCKRLGSRIGSLTPSSRAFVARIIAASVIVSAIGAFIDFYLLTGFSVHYGTGTRVLVFDAVKWSVAVILILVSVFAPCYLLLRMKAGPAALVSGIIALLNPVFWLAIGEYGEIVTFSVLAISLVSILPLLSGLGWWHASQYTSQASAPGIGLRTRI